MIQESVKKHNWDKFSQRVDVKELSESAFDDLIDVAMEKDKTLDNSTKTMAAGFAQMLKPAVTGAIEHAVKDYVENGEVEKRKKDGDKKSLAVKSRLVSKQPITCLIKPMPRNTMQR